MGTKRTDPWKKSFSDQRFSVLDGFLYHRTKHTSVVVSVDRDSIAMILHKCHDTLTSGHFPTDRTVERVKVTAWWPNWRQEVI